MICENYTGWYPPLPRKAKSVQCIIAEICFEFDITEVGLKGRSKLNRFVVPRWKAAARMRDELGMSSPEIARELGQRDHTTILNGFKRWDQLQKDMRE